MVHRMREGSWRTTAHILSVGWRGSPIFGRSSSPSRYADGTAGPAREGRAMAASLSFVKKVAPKSMDAMAIAEVRPFGTMPELARITQTPHYGAYGFCFSEALGGSLISKDDQSTLPP